MELDSDDRCGNKEKLVGAMERERKKCVEGTVRGPSASELTKLVHPGHLQGWDFYDTMSIVPSGGGQRTGLPSDASRVGGTAMAPI